MRPRFASRARKACFCRSATTCSAHAAPKTAQPAMSAGVPNAGELAAGTALAYMTGSETPKAQMAWNVQKPAKATQLPRIVSKRASPPRLQTRTSRKPPSSRRDIITKTEIAMPRGGAPPRPSVSAASSTKLIDPARSVSRSNWHV